MMNKMDEMFDFWGVECGEHKDHLNFLIKDESDLKKFMRDFYTGNIVKSMYEFQLYKRSQNEISEELFLAKCKENKKEALEGLLQEPISVNRLNYLLRYSLTEKEIFARYKRFPERSFLRLVKGVQKEVKPSFNLLVKL